MPTPTRRALLLVLALLTACRAATTTNAPRTGAATSARASPLLQLWEVRAPNGSESWVLGTYHLGVQLDEALPGDHVRRIDGARVVIGEIDIPHMDPAAAAPYMLLPEGEDLATRLPPELWQPLVSRLSTVPEQRLHRVTELAAMVLVMADDASRAQARRHASDSSGADAGAGADTSAGTGSATAPVMLDVEVFQRAVDRGVPTAGLETLEQQLALMGALPTSEMVSYLRAMLLPGRDGSVVERGSVAQASDAFVDGDLTPIWEMIESERLRAPAVFDALLFERNAAWVGPLTAELDRGGAFVAVGLGHLLGPRGLLALLTARGYDVHRVPRDP
ncbi:MAG: TraB/GumN family protein [Sandaracinus sp.]